MSQCRYCSSSSYGGGCAYSPHKGTQTWQRRQEMPLVWLYVQRSGMLLQSKPDTREVTVCGTLRVESPRGFHSLS